MEKGGLKGSGADLWLPGSAHSSRKDEQVQDWEHPLIIRNLLRIMVPTVSLPESAIVLILRLALIIFKSRKT